MKPKITIVLPELYLPLDEYCRRLGKTKVTACRLIECGKLSIKLQSDQKKFA